MEMNICMYRAFVRYFSSGFVVTTEPCYTLLEYIIFIISSSKTWAFKYLLFSHCQIHYNRIVSDDRFEFDTNEQSAIKQCSRNFDLNGVLRGERIYTERDRYKTKIVLGKFSLKSIIIIFICCFDRHRHHQHHHHCDHRTVQSIFEVLHFIHLVV